MLRTYIFICSTIALLLTGCSRNTIHDQSSSGRDSKPNIVIILADDFGIGDIQAHFPDNKIATPYLDAFSAESMRFTNAHSGSAVCTPTRYGLLTGRYAWRTRLQEWVLACYEPPLIAADRLTLPGFLRDRGYNTACIGKWHLGWEWAGPQPNTMEEQTNSLRTKEWDYTKPVLNGPTTRGFDYYFGTDVPNQPPFTFIENDRVFEQPTEKFEYVPNDGRALPAQFDGNPMVPGWQFDQILPELTQRAVEYIHDQAQEEEPFFLYFPMTSPHTPIVPTEQFKGKSGIALVADFIMETDWSAGQVIQALEDVGVAEDTLIIFTSDNGHLPTEWNTLIEAGHFPSGPYRGRKADIWEGGHRVPFMVRWPNRIEAGLVNDDILSLNDLFATCAELLGSVLPNDAGEDSISFLSTIFGENDEPHRGHVVSHSVGGEFAYMEGSWKVVYKNAVANRNQSRGKSRIVELYNLEEDIAEANNLSENESEIAERLGESLKRIVARGTSRAGPIQANDAEVNVEVTQTVRWVASLAEGED
ncbi:MAG: arylsulfatase [Opitutales bacterium]|jgi:arylsulfatase A-like enzyme|nr:arylsulfatase [Opitutales bacterium]MBT7864972.1 arylsulfatase [Opitutales bacterium]